MFFGTSQTTSGGRYGYGGTTPSRSQILGQRYQPFANPFFDQAGTYLPSNIKQLFSFCRYYYMTHGVVNAITGTLSEYPVTDIILQHKEKSVVDKWMEQLHGVYQYQIFQQETNLDFFTYGIAFVSVAFPFKKKLTCAVCNAKITAVDNLPHWRYQNHRFYLSCPKCGQADYVKSVEDDYDVGSYKQINLVRWNPEYISIFFNEATGDTSYTYEVPGTMREHVIMGRKDLIATTPSAFLEAIKERRPLVFDTSMVFVLRRPSVSSVMRGWGMPLIMPVLKDVYYVQVMKKAQESVLLTHLVPQVFLFPQPGSNSGDPFTTTNLLEWRDHIRREIARQRMDPSYYGILPFPLGHQTVGVENGRSLLLMPEIEKMTEQVIIGMGFTPDLMFGAGSYAGNNVSMRILENKFMNVVLQQKRLLEWVMARTARRLQWEVPRATFKPFRMADDLQRQAYFLNLAQLNKISDTTLLGYADLKFDSELELLNNETARRSELVENQQIQQAQAMGAASLVAAKFQAQSQGAMQRHMQKEQMPPPDPFVAANGSGLAGASPVVTLDAAASALATRLSTLPPAQRQALMDQLTAGIPEFASMVEQAQMAPPGMDPMMQAMQAGQPGVQGPPMPLGGSQSFGGVDMRPMPQQLPPRRPGGV
jgi:hypothetical protein